MSSSFINTLSNICWAEIPSVEINGIELKSRPKSDIKLKLSNSALQVVRTLEPVKHKSLKELSLSNLKKKNQEHLTS